MRMQLNTAVKAAINGVNNTVFPAAALSAGLRKFCCLLLLLKLLKSKLLKGKEGIPPSPELHRSPKQVCEDVETPELPLAEAPSDEDLQPRLIDTEDPVCTSKLSASSWIYR